jgi:hypothetical protein
MKTKMTAIFATLMIALMAAGFAYAHWSETLYIDGTVNTGSVKADFVLGSCWDSEPTEKDVSHIVCEWKATGVLEVTVDNAYPSIDYYCTFDLMNTGSVPFIIQSITFTGDVPGTVEVTGLAKGDQIANGKSETGTVHVHLVNGAAQEYTYTFKVTIVVVQWNEYEP